jgi:pyruvate dehydrogenase E1 component
MDDSADESAASGHASPHPQGTSMADETDPLGVEHDSDPEETREWIESLASTLEREGVERAHFLLEKLVDHARRSGAHLPFDATTSYVNTIPVTQQPRVPGDPGIERRIRSLIRWNALAMVVNANKSSSELGGHIASFASAATLYDVGFNHFFRGTDAEGGGDLVYFQGHSAPGIYARAFLEGRISEEQLRAFRQEVDGSGLSSYPHPYLMPDFWQFSTVSMGLTSMLAIYQARFMRYLEHRGILDTSNRKVWAFLGDGEMDEPESLGAISLPARERLDNLVFVVNCNLQRLDGPVRGDGKIIQELEAVFRGAGWNVIKVIWGSYWDPLLQRDTKGILRKRMMECVDGEYQGYKAKGGAFTREHFFGKYPETAAMVANMSDEEIWWLNRGGHDPNKVYAAYAAAMNHKGQPTVILAKTVKGYGMGEAGEGLNPTHQQKKMGEEALKAFRDRFSIPIGDDKIGEAPFYRPPDTSKEVQYLRARRKELGGYLPARRRTAAPLTVPSLDAFEVQLKGSGDHQMSTTMVFVRILTQLVRDRNIGKYIVPIVPDEARTFGMEGLFRQIGIYSSVGQLYEPVDAEQLMSYKEMKDGQILEEGINEAGAMSSFIAAGTAHSNHGVNMIPFYCFYSMFGFQRIGDFAWAAGDMRTRGFMMGGTAGRTTLSGEGLQHQDGHNLITASSIPNCVSYDPTFAYEMAVIIQDGIRRMYHDQEDVFYYVTMMNENWTHPAMPEGAREGILRGLYLLREADKQKKAPRIQLLGSGAILREVLAAADMLAEDFGVLADLWSATSLNELRRDGIAAERWSMLHPQEKRRQSYVETCLVDRPGPIVAATDSMRLYADQIRPYLPGKHYAVLGTDGFGRSDTRKKLRHFFEVDRRYVVVAALKALADTGAIDVAKVREAIQKYGIDPEKPNPVTV